MLWLFFCGVVVMFCCGVENFLSMFSVVVVLHPIMMAQLGPAGRGML